MPALNSFDDLCRAVFVSIPSTDTTAWAFSTSADISSAPSSDAEYTLSLLLQCQPYELARSALPSTEAAAASNSSSFPEPLPSPPAGEAPGTMTSKTTPTIMHRRLPLGSVTSPVMEQRVLSILRQAGVKLLELPYDRDMGGSHAVQKSRSEMLQLAAATNAAASGATMLERPVVLAIDDDAEPTSMWLIPEDDWIQYTARVRFWRQESHRLKAVERHTTLVKAIRDRWTTHRRVEVRKQDQEERATSPASSMSANQSSKAGSPFADKGITPSPIATLPSTSGTAYWCYVASNVSLNEQDQAQALLAFVHQYGDELSARSTIRGLIDFIRKQIGDPQLLAWTLDSVNLTEQKLDITLATLDLLACLGLQLVDTTTKISASSSSSSSSSTDTVAMASMTSSGSPRSNSLTVCNGSGGTTSSAKGVISQTPEGSDSVLTATTMEDLVWTFGLEADDRRLVFLVESLHQNKDPARSLSKTIRDRYLHDRHTVAAGSVGPIVNIVMCQLPIETGSPLSLATPPSPQGQQQQLQQSPSKAIDRRPELIVARSRWSKSAAAAGGSAASGGAVGRAGRDLADLARWATSCCTGRLDWLWRWFYGWLRPSSLRRGGGSGSRNAKNARTGSSKSSSKQASRPPSSTVKTRDVFAATQGSEERLNTGSSDQHRSPALRKQDEDDDNDSMSADSGLVIEHRVRSNDENV
ncbi:hypothetical protein BGW42_008634 [Actinomortierella wolfii]|nr:hypothetical protein BGW42_008634 [Actinomortierella wolfii]